MEAGYGEEEAGKRKMTSFNDNASYVDILKKVKEGLREDELEDTRYEGLITIEC